MVLETLAVDLSHRSDITIRRVSYNRCPWKRTTIVRKLASSLILQLFTLCISTYEGGTGAAASVPVAARCVPGGGGRNMGRYVTIRDMSDMPTEK